MWGGLSVEERLGRGSRGPARLETARRFLSSPDPFLCAVKRSADALARPREPCMHDGPMRTGRRTP